MQEVSIPSLSSSLSTSLVQNFLGDQLKVINNDYIGEIIKLTGVFSKRELFLLASIFSRLPLQYCLEIGGNIGNHTSLFSKFFRHTHVFEPNPLVLPILQENITRNKLRATAHNLGISNEETTLSFHIDQKNLGASSFVQGHVANPSAVITAPVTTGDAFVTKNEVPAIDYIKIDAEGLEGRIIDGLKKTIALYQPLISLEWNCEETRKDFRQFDIFRSVLKGYSLRAMVKPFPKDDYAGTLKALKRFVMRHIVYREQKVCLGPFVEEKDYDMIVLFPERFSDVIETVRYTENIPQLRMKA